MLKISQIPVYEGVGRLRAILQGIEKELYLLREFDDQYDLDNRINSILKYCRRGEEIIKEME